MVIPIRFYPDNCADYMKPVDLSFWHHGLNGLYRPQKDFYKVKIFITLFNK